MKLKLSVGRVISFQVVKARNAALPTFLFLPGVNRSLLADEAALEALSNEGFGVVTMNFSTQPFSVNQLSKGALPDFRATSYTIEQLGAEVSALADVLKKKFAAKNIIPVSISYSSAVSSTLNNFPFIIDAVPMTSSAAVNPELEAYRAYLKTGEIFNPIFGPGITRSLLDQSYYKKWATQVDSIVEQFDLNKDRRADMIEGYTVLSRATEGFVWDLKKTPSQTRRVFLFARDDSPSLLKDQLQLFLNSLDSNSNSLAFIVNDSGHVLPVDQPVAYANILSFLASSESKSASGIFEVQPGAKKQKNYQGAEAKKYIKAIINSLN
ncbi:MAG: hypothetical protein WC635_06040 [Bacteriovorax sp.]